MTAFELIPAIDIKDGRCVCLRQGDYKHATIVDHDPVGAARRWAELGASRLHVCDLDGAQAGRPLNAALVFAMIRAVNIPVQLSGGLRDHATVEAALNLGVDRVVLGSAVITEPDIVANVIRQFGQRIAVGIDARHGWVATHGWRETSQIRATDLMQHLVTLGVHHVIYTDIIRDGMLSGPNIAALTDIVAPHGPSVIAAGGVASVDDVLRIAATGATGAIIGQALYSGRIDLPSALSAIAEAHYAVPAGEHVHGS